MIAIHQKRVLATAAFAALGMFGTQAPAYQPISGPVSIQNNFLGAISGKIDVAESLFPNGFPSDPCRGLVVRAEVPAKKQPSPAPTPSGINLLGTPAPVMTTEGKSGKMTGHVNGSTLECGYSIQGLSAGRYTVVPNGHPRGFEPPPGTGVSASRGGFSPAQKNVKLRSQGVLVDSASHVNLAFKLFGYSPNGGN
jgi:hypothetical protein